VNYDDVAQIYQAGRKGWFLCGYEYPSREMSLLADYRKKLVSENLCLAGLGQKLELVSISLPGE